MTDSTLRRRRGLSEKKKVLRIFINTTEETTFKEIIRQLSINPLCVKGLLVALRKSNNVFYDNGVWSAKEKSTTSKKPPYPNFDKEHEEWMKQVLAKKQFNPDGN